MPAAVVFAVYGSVCVIVIALLFFLRSARWYWHVLAVIAALAIGLAPLPESWHTPERELMVGGIFLFLFVWGAAAPLFPKRHGQDRHHAPPHKA